MAPRATSIDARGARNARQYPDDAPSGGVTPMHGSMTPAREAAWNPTATPAHLPHDNWEPTSTAGADESSTSMGYHARWKYSDSRPLAGPTPGGYGGPTPGGYGGPTPGGYGGPTPEDTAVRRPEDTAVRRRVDTRRHSGWARAPRA